MRSWSLFRTCVLRSRCPLCAQGALFQGWLRLHALCPVCGLRYEQWSGEWITPTYLASSVGTLVALGLMGGMLATGVGLDAGLPAELPLCAAGGAVALATLRGAKAFWLAFLFGIGGLEVSAATRARLRWSGSAGSLERAPLAERRGYRLRPPARAYRKSG